MSSIRLLTYNIRYGGVGREEPLTSVLRAYDADIVLLQEATNPAVVERLADATGMLQWAASGGQSLGFLSRRPVDHYEWHQPRFSRHAFLEVVPAGTSTRLFGVHLSAVHAAWTERRRVVEIRALLKSIARHQTGLHVLAGDFNTLAPGEQLDSRKLPPRLRPLVWLSGGRIRWRTIQQVLDAGYVDGFRYLHSGDLGVTFPTHDPHLRLDYVFIPEAFVDRLESCDIIASHEARHASDHFPLLAKICL